MFRENTAPGRAANIVAMRDARNLFVSRTPFNVTRLPQGLSNDLVDSDQTECVRCQPMTVSANSTARTDDAATNQRSGGRPIVKITTQPTTNASPAASL